MKKVFKWIGLTIVSLILLFVIIVSIFLNFAPTFGADSKGESLEAIKASKNYDGEKFINLIETKVDTRDPQSGESIFSSILKMLNPDEDKNPKNTLPSAKFKSNELNNNSFVWLGHSTILMNINNTIILTDPVFHNASPIPGTIEPFEIENPILISDLPKVIDVVIISHDHYDHLDHKAIQKLNKKVNYFYVPLGLKAHLLKWGIPNDKVIEKDWHDVITYNNISFTMTPARHFSGRGLTNRFSTLWCSWVIKSSDINIFFNGDSGYFEEYQSIGNKYGPFDISFMENGAYDKDWAEIHMLPEEAVKASIDLQSKIMFPIHWGKFDLGKHKWDEPIIRAYNESQLKNVNIATPLIGQIFNLNNIPHQKWWEMIK